MSDVGADQARSAGRGLALIAGAKAWFIVTAYAVHVVLPRLLGSAEAYGLFSTAISTVSIANNVLIAATLQTVSKLVSEDEDRAPATLRQGLGIQLAVGVGLAGVFFLIAEWLATTVLKDAALTPLLRISAAVVLSYALYAALMGYLNGRQRFSRQAALDTTFSTLRTAGILLGAGLGFGVFGAISGFAAAAVGILLVAAVTVGIGRAGPRLPLSRWTSFMWPIWLYQSFLNGILLIDLLVLKSTIATIAERGGASAAEAAAVANQYAGLYSAAQKFAFIPYQLMLSLTFIVFPMISRATSAGDREATRRTIRGAMRFALLVLVGIAAPIAGASAGILRVAYPDEYVVGSDALAILVVGAAAFALFVISATALSGAGRPGIAAWIAAVGLAAVVGLDRTLLEVVGIGDRTLVATSMGTASGMGLAMIISAVAVRATLGAYMAPLAAVRILLAGAAAWGTARFVPHESALGALSALCAGAVVFGIVLLVAGELGRADLDRVLGIVGRKKKSG